MQTPGIVGGIGPESTIDYYRGILATYRERRPDGSLPPVLVTSIDLQRMLRLVASDLPGLTDYLSEEIARLARAGADFGLLASNTPHVVFDALERKAPIPLLGIVETARAAAQATGLRRLGLLGTRFTMEGRFYPDAFSRAGLTLAVPAPEDRTVVHDRYMGELVHGVFRPETREELLGVVERMRRRDDVDAVLLAGTELPLILRGCDVGVPLLDTARIHVEATVDRMLADPPRG